MLIQGNSQLTGGVGWSLLICERYALSFKSYLVLILLNQKLFPHSQQTRTSLWVGLCPNSQFSSTLLWCTGTESHGIFLERSVSGSGTLDLLVAHDGVQFVSSSCSLHQSLEPITTKYKGSKIRLSVRLWFSTGKFWNALFGLEFVNFLGWKLLLFSWCDFKKT